MSKEPVRELESVEASLGTLLRWGTLLSAAVIAVGGLAYLAQHGNEAPNYATFRGEPADLRSLSGIFDDVRQRRSLGVMQLGMMLLVATPIARVMGALAAFGLRRDWLYVLCSALVLTALLYSLLAS